MTWQIAAWLAIGAAAGGLAANVLWAWLTPALPSGAQLEADAMLSETVRSRAYAEGFANGAAAATVEALKLMKLIEREIELQCRSVPISSDANKDGRA
jgi:hypothetical protein